MDTLHPVTKGSMNPNEVLAFAVKATSNDVESAIDIAGNLSKAHDAALLSTCQEMLRYSATELGLSLTSVRDKELNTLPDRSDDIKNWLSAALAYQETCRDSVAHDPQVKQEIEKNGGLTNATQLTSNALAIMSNITDILDVVRIPSNVTSSISRNLVEDEAVGEEGVNGEAYPSWFSEGDRRRMVAVQTKDLKPNVVVAKDGSGDFQSISEALNAMPKQYGGGRYVIYVKERIYTETVTVTEKMLNVVMYGDGARKTMVTGNKSVMKGVNTLTTEQTATFGAY